MTANGARKFDNNKPPITTGVLWRFPRAIKEVANVSAVGAEKYEVVLPDDNCLKVPNGFNRYADAVGRHLVDRALSGPINTEKGGALPPEGRNVRHLAQLIWDGLAILEMELIEEEMIKTNPTKSLPPASSFPAHFGDPAYPVTTDPLPSPSPHNHSHTSSDQEHTLPIPGLMRFEEELLAQLDSDDKSQGE